MDVTNATRTAAAIAPTQPGFAPDVDDVLRPSPAPDRNPPINELLRPLCDGMHLPRFRHITPFPGFPPFSPPPTPPVTPPRSVELTPQVVGQVPRIKSRPPLEDAIALYRRRTAAD